MDRSPDRQRLWNFMAELTSLSAGERRAMLSRHAREHDLPDPFARAETIAAGAATGPNAAPNDDAASGNGLRSAHESRICALERRVAELEARIAELERKQ